MADKAPTDQERAAMITVICPNLACRKAVRVSASYRGHPVRCGHCNTPFRVPPSAPAKPPEPQR